VSRHAEASLLVEGLRRVAQESAPEIHRELMGESAAAASPTKRAKR